MWMISPVMNGDDSKNRTPGSAEGLPESELPTTAHPCERYAAVSPAPMPCELPVTITTFCSLSLTRPLSRRPRMFAPVETTATRVGISQKGAGVTTDLEKRRAIEEHWAA